MTIPARASSFLALSLFAAGAAAQTTTLVSVGSGGAPALGSSSSPSISGDGRFVAFDSTAANLVSGDTNGQLDQFVRDLATGQTERVSVSSSGQQANGLSGRGVLSADGRFIAFVSSATNLGPADTNAFIDIYVRDRQTGQVELVSVSSAGVQQNGHADAPAISANGRFVAFDSTASNLVAGDTNGASDIFVHDRQTGRTRRASLSSSGAEPNGPCIRASVSNDGRWVVFQSTASNLVVPDANPLDDVYLHDMWSGATTLVDLSSSDVQAGARSSSPILTPDGRFVLFTSEADNLAPNDTNGSNDVFVRDLFTGVTSLESISATGAHGNSLSASRGISADGRFVVFISGASNLVSGDTNLFWDVYERDRVTGETVCVSFGAAGNSGNAAVSFAGVSDNGDRIAFQSSASNLVAGDTNAADDIFLRDRGALLFSSTCFGDGTQATPCPCANVGGAGRGCENSAGSGGAFLSISGFANPDSAVLGASGLLASTTTIFLQGSAQLGTPLVFGDGVRCVGGLVKRLYVESAIAGSAIAPAPGDLPLGVKSTLLGDPIASGTSRWYQAWYRDPDASFCAAPQGNLWNVSNGVRVDW